VTHIVLISVGPCWQWVAAREDKGAPRSSLITRRRAPLMFIFQQKHLSITKFIMSGTSEQLWNAGASRHRRPPTSAVTPLLSQVFRRRRGHASALWISYSCVFNVSLYLQLYGECFLHFSKTPKHNKIFNSESEYYFCSEEKCTLGYQNVTIVSLSVTCIELSCRNPFAHFCRCNYYQKLLMD